MTGHALDDDEHATADQRWYGRHVVALVLGSAAFVGCAAGVLALGLVPGALVVVAGLAAMAAGRSVAKLEDSSQDPDGRGPVTTGRLVAAFELVSSVASTAVLLAGRR